MSTFYSSMSDYENLKESKLSRARNGSGNGGSRVVTNSSNAKPTREEKDKPRALTAQVHISPSDMDTTYFSKQITTEQFCAKVNQLMKVAYPQWEGSSIEIDQSGLHMYFWFTYKQNVSYEGDQIEVLKLTQGADPNNRTSVGLIQAINDRGKYSNVYELTQEGKDSLSEFIYINQFTIDGNRLDRNYRWDKITSEVQERVTTAYNMFSDKICFRVEIDPIRLIRKMYGTKSKDSGSPFIYEIKPIRNIFGNNWLIEIRQHDEKKEAEICRIATGYTITSNLGIYRG